MSGALREHNVPADGAYRRRLVLTDIRHPKSPLLAVGGPAVLLGARLCFVRWDAVLSWAYFFLESVRFELCDCRCRRRERMCARVPPKDSFASVGGVQSNANTAHTSKRCVLNPWYTSRHADRIYLRVL